MMPGSRRALWGALSIAAVLLPAAGIAYLGAVSYRADRSLVAAKLDEQFRAAQAIAAAVERELEAALTAVDGVLEPGIRPSPAALAALRDSHPLAASPFRIGGDGRLQFPFADALRLSPAREPFLSRAPRSCPERGFDRCVRELVASRRRAAQLVEARRAELAGRPVRAAYQALARFDDTGPEALLGLARLARRRGDAELATARYRELDRRFGARNDEDGVDYALLAAWGTAQTLATSEAQLALYQQLVERQFRAPAAALALIAETLRVALAAAPLPQAQRQRIAALDARLAAARREARFAATLAAELDELARSAVAEARGRSAGTANRSLVYRRDEAGGVVGVVVDREMLEAAAARANVRMAELGRGARAIAQRIGEPVIRGATRTLASASFGPVLPHLSLVLVNDRIQPDPLDAIAAARGRRHLVLTGALAALLIIGLIATIRGAARQRELARLKSDFVSTVSHELKTPLTSIRMFGEMLQQGMAGADQTRQARYHDIIVKESERLGLLIANLLDYAQLERGMRGYSARRERLADLASDAVETFRRFGGEDTLIEVQIAPEARDAEVLVDREVLVQSLLNLLANASKYGLGAPIGVEVQRRDGAGVVAVTDRGPGIPAAEHERIFREFYRAPAARSSGVEGTGLGLALVKRHVEAQGGIVELSSAMGRGSTFAIVLPCAVSEVA